MSDRKIIHVDMDAFYASVEQRDDPRLRGRPVAVGSCEARGVVAAASYEARAFGVRSAMASVTARRMCPELIFVPPRFDAYRAVSGEIRKIFLSWTDLVEPISLDEAYLDVTERGRQGIFARSIARDIRARIREETGLTASAGVSYNKFLAKMASGMNKPDGMRVIRPEQGEAFVADLNIEAFHGIGEATAARMRGYGVRTGADLKRLEMGELIRIFGKAGPHYHDIARGIDRREVRPDRERKSVGAEDTFADDIRTLDLARERAAPLVRKVWSRCREAGVTGRTVTVKIKFADLSRITRSRSLPEPVRDADDLARVAGEILSDAFPAPIGVRLLGVTLSSLCDPDAAQPGFAF